MVGTVAGIVAVLFLLFALLALAKPIVHAIRVGGASLGQPSRVLEQPPPLSEQPPPLSEPPGLSGVREPRRPTPMGSAGAVALEVDEPAESIDAVAREGRTHRSSGVDARAA
jgi:hypothetical protein